MLAVASALAIGGCQPRLAGNGHYACARGPCPASAPFCHADLRCYTTPDTMGFDAGPRDGGMMGGAYAPCPSGSGCMMGQICLANGYCSPPCASATTCPMPAGRRAICASDMRCRMGCASATDCPTSMDCVSGIWERATMPAAVCVEPMIAFPSGYLASCTSDATCPLPSNCAEGACLLDCGPTGICPRDHVCVMTPTSMRRACLRRCAGGTCPMGDRTECRPGGGEMLCYPPSWPR